MIVKKYFGHTTPLNDGFTLVPSLMSMSHSAPKYEIVLDKACLTTAKGQYLICNGGEFDGNKCSHKGQCNYYAVGEVVFLIHPLKSPYVIGNL